ncbi:MAG: DUF4175 family protein [Calditrichaeota bacterium]|nr:MAG: DUF4175 family protein [Calditrichota bacterium]
MKNIFFFMILNICFFQEIYSGGLVDRNAGQTEQYNQALELYLDGNYVESSEILENVFFKNTHREIDKLLLQSANHYRMGEKDAQVEKDVTGAVDSLNKSIGLLKRVIELDRENKTARNNLERAMLLREKLLEQQEISDQSEQSPQEQAEQLQKEQNQMAENQDKGNQEHMNSQEDLRRRTEELKDKSEPDSPESQSLEKAVEAQKEAEEALTEGDLEKAGDKQSEAAGYLQEAAEKMASGNDRPAEIPEQHDGSDHEDQLIQSIIDSEFDRDTSSDETGSGVTVERNW